MLVCTRIVEIILGYRPFGIDPKFDCTLIRLGQSKLPHWLTLRLVRYSPFQIGQNRYNKFMHIIIVRKIRLNAYTDILNNAYNKFTLS